MSRFPQREADEAGADTADLLATADMIADHAEISADKIACRTVGLLFKLFHGFIVSLLQKSGA
jgi:hypothetical protein